MPEAVLAISVGALLVVGATTAALSIIERIQAGNRVQEVATVVDNVWGRYVNAAEYTGLTSASIASSMPERMTNDAQDEIYLGGGQLPVGLFPGVAAAAHIGAGTPRTFFMVIGTTDFPVQSVLTCERILSRWDDQDARLFGFQVAPALATLATAPAAAAATNFTVRKVGTVVDFTPGSPPNVYPAGPHALRQVLSQHIRHACDIVVGLAGGARLIMAFS